MATEVTSIALAVDSTQVTQASSELDRLAAAGGKAESATEALKRTFDGLGGAAAPLRRTRAEADNVAEGFRRLGEQGRIAFDRLSNADRLTAGLSSAGRSAAQAAAQTQAAAAAITRSTQQVGRQAQLTAQQAAQLSFQLNDIFAQIASGGSPLIALIQQGSQLNGTFGGLSGTFRALASVFTPLRIAIGGVVAAVGGIAFAALRGNQESAELARALTLSGNAAGITEGQFNSLAQTLAQSTATSIGSARDTLRQLAASGRFAQASLIQAGTAAQFLAKSTGTSTDDIVKQFVRAADGVADFAESANKQYNFLTAEQLRYIRTLEDTGQAQRALEVTFAALAGRAREAASETGILENAYQGLKNAISGVVDGLLSLGRATTPEARLARIQAQIEALQNTADIGIEFGGGAAASGLLDNLRQQEAALQAIVTGQQSAAKASADRAAREQAGAEFDRIKLQNLNAQQRLEKEIQRIRTVGIAAGRTEKEIQEQIAAARERILPKGRKPVNLDRAELNADVADIRSALNQLTTAYGNAETILEAQRSAGIVAEAAYYDAKRGLIELNEQAQVRALEAENQRLGAQNLTGRDRIEVQKQIAANEAQIAIVTANATAKITVANIQQQDALKKLAQGYAEARASQEAYLDSLIQAQRVELQGLGQGNAARDRQRAEQELRERFLQQRLRLESERRRGQITDAQFQQELQLLAEFQQKALAVEQRGQAARLQAQRDYTIGAREALQNYIGSVADLSGQIEGLFSRAFQGAEDALTEFFTTGKASLSDFARSIVADINRIIVRENITGPLAKVIQEGFGSGQGIGGAVKNIFGGLFGGLDPRTPGFGDGIGQATQAAGVATQTAATAALTAATTAATAATTADAAATAAKTAAETGAAAAIAAASASSAAALTALATTATAASTALAAVAATSGTSAGGDVLGTFLSLAGGRAIGGPVSAGRIYEINEKGAPEIASFGGRDYLLTGSQRGEVKPASTGTSQNFTINVPISYSTPVPKATMAQNARLIGIEVQKAISRIN